MTPSFRGLRSLAGALVAVLTVGFLLGGCGRDASSEPIQTVPGVSLEEADLVDDPTSWQGESLALLDSPGLHPVADNPMPDLPVTITDAQGTDVTVTDISRILAVDIYGTNARTIADLGLADNLVGRDVSTKFPEAAELPLVTQNGHELNAEAILALDPTVVVADTTLGPWDVLLQVREAGIPVIITSSERSLERAAGDIRFLGEALGVPDEGDALADRTQREIDNIEAQIADIAPQGDGALRMAFLYVRGGSGIYYLFGGESATGSLITHLGGIDVATDTGWDGMRPVTDEGIIAMQPDVLLVMTNGLESAGGVDGLLESVPALAQTPAGQNRRFVAMEDTQVLAFGPISADVLEALAVAIYAPGDAPYSDDMQSADTAGTA